MGTTREAEGFGAGRQDEAEIAVRDAIIVGAGFGGIGIAAKLREAGFDDLLILERGHGPGGVWRANTYPGAACDVPSHLYSFSFAPNPDWSRKFSPQGEILRYLERCVDRFGLREAIRTGAEVAEAAWDGDASVWRVRLVDGERLAARILLTATGQLSRAVIPALPGADKLAIPAFHSAQWDHTVQIDGRNVAVIGTGASAHQFVPEIARKAARVTVYQRSPAWIIPRPDRPYAAWEKRLFRRIPLLARLHRLAIYATYETRALAFTRIHALMDVAVGMPARRLLRREIADPALRAKLTPDYKIGCKRILLTSDYLAAIARPNVELVTTPIASLRPRGVATTDGVERPADVLVWGTGFAATSFLAPMRITGRDGRTLNEAWAQGAAAYLGMSVPGFPNFFILYGPNTNLGHSSIIFMLESQFAHVLRVLTEAKRTGSSRAEVLAEAHGRFSTTIHKRLAGTVWAACRSWYVDETGRNTVNWPGFTFSYRFLARHGSLAAYRFDPPASAETVRIEAPGDALERGTAAFLRLFLRATFRALAGPPSPATRERAGVEMLAALMPGLPGVRRTRDAGPGRSERVVARGGAGGVHAGGAILYLHGGAYCLGSPRTHRSITTRLASLAAVPVHVPDYRLAPENPWPAALEDALAAWHRLRQAGHPASRIVVAGDSAGAGLGLALALRLRADGEALPAGLALVSPFCDPTLGGASIEERAAVDPMIRRGWLEQGIAWLAAAPDAAELRPLEADLGGMPPMLVQVGSDEILHDDAVRLAARARAAGVPCRLEIHAERWHVFALQAVQLRSARSAIRRLAVWSRDAIERGSRDGAEPQDRMRSEAQSQVRGQAAASAS